jgi:Fuc2NAc and GlcNAc transferase
MPNAPLTVLLLIISIPLCSMAVSAIRTWALRTGMLAIPNERSSHRLPVPLGGGIALVIVPLALLAAFYALIGGRFWQVVLVYAIGSAAIAGISWYDDQRGVSRLLRFVVHILAALIAVAALGYWKSLYLPILGTIHPGLFGLVLTVVWFAGMVNAYNFIDGIDGLAGSQAIVAGLGWMVMGLWTGQPLVGALGAVIAGSSLGFVLHNWAPARIFMGDAGSAFLGYTFAFLPLMATAGLGGRHLQHPSLVFAGVLLVWPVIFDSVFTVFRRFADGENIFAPHRTFLFHRLVAGGFSHVSVALRYIGFSSFGFVMAVAWAGGVPGMRFAAILLTPMMCAALWLFVLYTEQQSRGEQGLSPSQPLSTAKHLMAEFVIPRLRRYGFLFARDGIIVIASLLAAELLRNNGRIPSGQAAHLPGSALVAVLGFVTTFYLFGIHRKTWAYPNFGDIRATIHACVIATIILSICNVADPGYHMVPISVVMVGGLITLAGTLGVRMWRPLLLPNPIPAGSERVLIIGAGHAGHLAAASLLGNPWAREHPVGFLDDDPEKLRRHVYGLPVLGSVDELGRVIQEFEVRSVLIALPDAPLELQETIAMTAQALGVPTHVIPGRVAAPGDSSWPAASLPLQPVPVLAGGTGAAEAAS